MAKIGCTTSPGLAANEDISSNDRENEKRGQAKLERAIAIARDVGATHVCRILEFRIPEVRQADDARGREALGRGVAARR